jgi:hypothetical protein
MQSIPGLTYFGKQVFVEDGVTEVPPPPIVVPPLNDFVILPWGTPEGNHTEFIPVGKILVMQLTIPNISSNGKYCNVAISPTTARDYYARQMSLSDAPYEFTRKLAPTALVQGQSGRIFFSVGGYPMDAYNRPNKQYADLTPGKTYYFNVAQVDSSFACHINYSVTVI